MAVLTLCIASGSLAKEYAEARQRPGCFLLLLAPASGQKTRADISEKVKDVREKVRDRSSRKTARGKRHLRAVKVTPRIEHHGRRPALTTRHRKRGAGLHFNE